MSDYQSVKPARNPEELIQKLKSRNLNITEEQVPHIKAKITNIGYFRLSGYFRPFQEVKDEFNAGTSFDDIMRIYEFDKQLRIITSPELKRIEIRLKALLTDVMSLAHGSDWYLKRELFMTDMKKTVYVDVPYCSNGEVEIRKEQKEAVIYNLLMDSIKESIERNKEKEYIKDFRDKYGTSSPVPSWMMMECISFGDLSRIFSLLKNTSEKKEISRQFGVVGPDIFASWLHGFLILRNACAHHSRIWNKKILKDLSFPRKSSQRILNPDLPKNHLRQFFGISCCLLRSLTMLNKEEALRYRENVLLLASHHGIRLTAMGFPADDKEHGIWIENHHNWLEVEGV